MAGGWGQVPVLLLPVLGVGRLLPVGAPQVVVLFVVWRYWGVVGSLGCEGRCCLSDGQLPGPHYSAGQGAN